MKAMSIIYKLIYERAESRGILIEKGPGHRRDMDHTGSGRRRVIFPGNGKVYEYRMPLIELGRKLDLISEDEYEDALLADGGARCPRCNVITSTDIIEKYGYCLNC